MNCDYCASQRLIKFDRRAEMAELDADIQNRVGRVRIDRSGRVAAVHSALDAGRYVEIRGNAGVGKSGVMRQLAELMRQEARDDRRKKLIRSREGHRPLYLNFHGRGHAS